MLSRVLCALFVAAFPAWASDGPFEIVRFEPGVMAVPRGWRTMEAPGELMYRQGDGIGVPAVDETGEPLQIGISVAKRENSKFPLDMVMTALIEAAGGNQQLEWTGREVVTIRLADGTEARLLRGEFLKGKTRRSLQLKLVAIDASSTLWVASAHLVGGKESAWPKHGSRLAKWLEAHLASLTFDEKKFDVKKVTAAYEEKQTPE